MQKMAKMRRRKVEMQQVEAILHRRRKTVRVAREHRRACDQKDQDLLMVMVIWVPGKNLCVREWPRRPTWHRLKKQDHASGPRHPRR